MPSGGLQAKLADQDRFLVCLQAAVRTILKVRSYGCLLLRRQFILQESPQQRLYPPAIKRPISARTFSRHDAHPIPLFTTGLACPCSNSICRRHLRPSLNRT